MSPRQPNQNFGEHLAMIRKDLEASECTTRNLREKLRNAHRKEGLLRARIALEDIRFESEVFHEKAIQRLGGRIATLLEHPVPVTVGEFADTMRNV